MIFTFVLGAFLSAPFGLFYWLYLISKYGPTVAEGKRLNNVLIPKAVAETQRIETESRKRRARIRRAREKELLALLDIKEYKECSYLKIRKEGDPIGPKYRETR